MTPMEVLAYRAARRRAIEAFERLPKEEQERIAEQERLYDEYERTLNE